VGDVDVELDATKFGGVGDVERDFNGGGFIDWFGGLFCGLELADGW
jgi:hypothetical protein